MIRYVIREISTGQYLTGDYIGCPTTTTPETAKQWQRKTVIVKVTKNLTFAYHSEQLRQANQLSSTNVLGSTIPALSNVPPGPMTPVYEIVEVEFRPTIVSSTVINATVTVRNYNQTGITIGMAEIV